MGKQLILIQRNLNKDDILWIGENCKPDNTTIYTEIHLKDSGLNGYNEPQVYQLAEEQKSVVNKNALKAVLDFGDLKADSKLSMAQRFQYQQLNIWHNNKFRVYFEIRDAMYQMAKTEELLENFESITIFSARDFLGVFEKNTRVMLLPANDKPRRKRSDLIFYLIKFLLRSILNVFFRHNPINKFLVISPSERVQPVIDMRTLQPGHDDPIFGYLLKKYGRELIILNEMNIPGIASHSLSVPILPRHHKYYELGEAIIFRALFSRKLYKEWKIVKNKYQRILQKLNTRENSLVNQAILKAMTSYQSSHNYYVFRYLAYRRYFVKRKIRAVIATDENSMFVKVILDAAKKANILTIGAQHGNIHPLHPAYVFSKDDMELHPMPDYTLLWGNRWKDILVRECNYRDDELVVVGQIRTDIINKLKEPGAPHEFTMVFASQPQLDPQLRERAALDVFRTAQELNVRLRVKLHPREKDPEFYLNLAREIDYAPEFTGDEDLYQVIQGADLVITCYSTVGAETAYFRKPLIILDYLKEDVNAYHQDGIAFQATNKEELEDFCARIRDGKLKIDPFIQEKYIEDCAYQIVGKVSSRIIEWLRELHPITSHSVE